MIEIVSGILILFGGAFCVIAGIGLMRMPDVFIRMHAATKVGTLGSGLILAAVAVSIGSSDVIAKVVLTVLFLLLTAPIGAHMIGRAALRIGIEPWRPDDMKRAEEAAKSESAKTNG
ncbi:monovalent cation/H(+) antiporter subunit G [Cognatishimia sp. F0-27]|uniref:monovalent cation/H(+) antiporter subunit G n=1 Tax=Cognatishimia sp. F0-27 TaxID=2816855 RepID=UPI001D0C75E1|nr:monovalent cation/H(+) antiporter subunit G [Cognatishimia sp. F0-27]MCC1491841.1 monovalent cation/H(+) antiporter subunit G [Cognatishimia sp. F0-27]